MKKLWGMILGLILMLCPIQAAASPALQIDVPAGLALSAIKMTGDEFIVIRNNSGETIPNLAQYWLFGYNNSNPLASGVSNNSQQLPTGPLAPNETVLLSSTGMVTCGAAMAGRLSVSLSDSSGFLQIAQMQLQNGSVAQIVSDAVSWSSGGGAFITSVPSAAKAPNALWYRYNDQDSKVYKWQQANLNMEDSCSYDVMVDGIAEHVDAAFLRPPDSEPYVIIQSVTAESKGQEGPVIAAANRGLQTPILNELLPNPGTPLSDETDEFIELYNPNSSAFDLSGFILQVASASGATAKTYTFPTGTHIAAKAFAAFMSEQTKLSMSNSGGQAWLLDPFGRVIGQTSAYGSAKDNQAWVLAKGKWAWSSESTPNNANVVKTPPSSTAKKASSKATVSKKTAEKVPAANAASKSGSVKASGIEEIAAEGKLHIYVLATTAGLALLYAGYEYRHDLRNIIYKLRRNRTDRAIARR